MFSKTSEYALCAVVAIARQPGRSVPLPQIAEQTRVPAPYLSKVLQALTAQGIVKVFRGKSGGYQLAVSPDSLTLYSVINAVDPLQRIHSCPLGLLEHSQGLCPVHRRMDTALAEMERVLSESTLTEVLAEPNPCLLEVMGGRPGNGNSGSSPPPGGVSV